MGSLEHLLKTIARGYAGPRVLRHIPVPAPAAGAEWSLTVPGGKVWAPLAVTFVFTTGAAAATRSVNLVFTDGTATFAFVNSDSTQIISLAYSYSYMLDFNPAGAAVVGTHVAACLPDLILPGGYSVGSLCDSLNALDTYTGIVVTVEELLEQPWGTADVQAGYVEWNNAISQVNAEQDRVQ